MLIKHLLTLAFVLLIPSVVIAQPSKAGDISVYWVYDHPVQYIEPEPEPEPELPLEILSNCWKYVKHIYPNTPNTATMRANLSDSGEIAIFYYPNSDLYHYAVVESMNPFIITDTNFSGYKKETRQESDLRLIGFYDLPN